MTHTEKIQAFNTELSYIKDKDIRVLAKALLELVPNYFFSIAASSTGNYHPEYALNRGGLLRHTKAACFFAHRLSEINLFELDDTELDCAIVALMLHDCAKRGVSDESKCDYTRFDHPILASNLIKLGYKEQIEPTLLELELTDKCCNCISLITCSIASHMGKWNKSSYAPDITLPLPLLPIQRFVHMCDFLAATKEIDMKNLV